MMRSLPLFCALVLLLVACDTPSPAFRGLPATRVTVDGSTFDVRVNGQDAEALRVNAEYAPRFGPIRDRARRAMAQVSGCEVRKVTGDQALAFGLLACKGVEPVERPKPLRLDCVPARGSTVGGVVQIDVATDCYAT